ncbi:CocE/NonD family hydrolase [Niveispirillum fermenti]|uniref:CocE/NonD family hydrolase n=1 Tax=Niveispirillum fermenti TaxID=1233113 RepID=UPI003A837166
MTAPVIRRSHYIAMPDGVRLALDVWLPIEMDGRLPAFLLSTRYWRAFDLVEGDPQYQPAFAMAGHLAARGYALVEVDSRGSGASFGQRACEWSPQERDDLGLVIDWIASRDWSDGRIVATGYSYGGNTAFMAASTGRKALVLTAPQFADFDIYRHNLFPGGVANIFLNDRWAALTAAQDRGDVEGVADQLPGIDKALFRRLVRGPAPVGGEDPARAIAGHAGNFNIGATARSVTFIDDAARLNAGWDTDLVMDSEKLSIHALRPAMEAAGTPIAYWAGWFDAGTAEGALELFNSVDGPMEVFIGPWSHGRRWHQDPFAIGQTPRSLPASENLDDLLSAAACPPTARRLHYYTLGADQWRTTTVWPPDGQQSCRLFLAGDGLLSEVPPVDGGADVHAVRADASTGRQNRWWTQIGCAPVHHPDRAPADALLQTYDSAPLDRAVEITGAPVLHLWMACDRPDAALFAYLEMVDSQGRVALLTEGVLRLMHRRVLPPGEHSFQADPAHGYRACDALPVMPGEVMQVVVRLLPISIRIPAGFRLRLALAGADADTFAPVTGSDGAHFTFHRDDIHASALELPLIGL